MYILFTYQELYKVRILIKKQDFKSGDGMLTTVWGPGLWHYLHTLSFNYPWHPTAQEKQAYKNQILLLEQTLPCKYCRINLKKNFMPNNNKLIR